MLWHDMMTSCELLAQVREPDSEGGYVQGFAVVGNIFAAITDEADTNEQRHGREDTRRTARITTEEPLSLGTAIRREGEGWRVTSDSVRSPSVASFDFWQASAERWEVADAQ